MTGATRGVVLQCPVEVLDTVPVATVQVELLAQGASDVGVAVPIVVRVVDIGPGYGAMSPIVFIIECCEIGEVGVWPSGRHLLLVVVEELPCILREIYFPDPSRVELDVLGPSRVQIVSNTLRSIEDNTCSWSGTEGLTA